MTNRIDAQPAAWLVRPYEASTWAVVLEPPSEETRRFMEFIPLYRHADKVSPDQHRAAMVALQNSKWPFMPADQRSEIIDIVIAAFGLEKAE